MKKYQWLYDKLTGQIQQGVYQAMDKLPSIRTLSEEYQVSISTVLTTLKHLEADGMVETYAKKGIYVCKTVNTEKHHLPVLKETQSRPQSLSLTDLFITVNNPEKPIQGVNFIHSLPPKYIRADILPAINLRYQPETKKAAVTRQKTGKASVYSPESVDNTHRLKVILSRQYLKAGSEISPQDFLLTSGCAMSVYLALKALLKPGDVVAVESPCFYGLIQRLAYLGLKVIEIPTHPENGMDMDALKHAMKTWPVCAVIINPNYANPVSFCMPDDAKKELIKITAAYDIPIIEDDIYSDTGFTFQRPRTVHSFADPDDNRVVLCSSVSKIIDTRLRLGWIAPGRYKKAIEQAIFYHSEGPSSMAVAAVEAVYLQQFERYLKHLKSTILQNKNRMLGWIEDGFPDEIKLNQPRGNFNFWIELPQNTDVMKIAQQMMEKQIYFMPGQAFSAAGEFRHCMRLSYGLVAENPQQEEAQAEAVKTIGNAIKRAIMH